MIPDNYFHYTFELFTQNILPGPREEFPRRQLKEVACHSNGQGFLTIVTFNHKTAGLALLKIFFQADYSKLILIGKTIPGAEPAAVAALVARTVQMDNLKVMVLLLMQTIN